MTIRRILFLSILTLATAFAPSARADCSIVCNSALCTGSVIIVTGTVEPDAAEPGLTVVTVDAVLHTPPGIEALKPGDKRRGGLLANIKSGRVVAYYATFDRTTPMGLFAIGADGNVHCGGEAGRTSAPEGSGVTPDRLVMIASAPTCGAELEAAGYPRPSCDDEASLLGCQIGRGKAGPAGLAAALATVALVARRARRRR